MRGPAMHSGMPGAVHHTVHHRTAHPVAVHRANHSVAAHHRLTRHPVAVHRSHVVRHVTHRLTHRAPRIAALRKNISAAHRFHAGVYRAPPGYRYRRWGFGQFLPSIYWGRDFWIADFLAFGLFAPPDGLVWVRYGPDALLIDEYTGEIIQVDYGVFF